MGIDASKSADRNRSSIKLRRKDFRTLLCENLERRELMAIDGPRLLSIAANTGEIFSSTSANNLSESPRELVLRFDASIDPSTIGNGIRITRAGGDGDFGPASPSPSVVVQPAYLSFSDPSNRRVVVARFSQPLLDDLYRVEVFGVDVASPPTTAIKDSSGLVLKPRRPGTDRDTYDFDLELGTKIIAVVPQPIDRSASGVLTQRNKDIEVYFNDSELYNQAVSTGGQPTDPRVVDRQFYKLIFTNETVSPNDDIVVSPNSISYDPVTRRAILTFAQDIQSYGSGTGTFRLRVGASELPASLATPIVPRQSAPASDPSGFLDSSQNIVTNGSNVNGLVTGSFSTVVSEEIRTIGSNQLLADYPGSNLEPGHRDIQDESHLKAVPGQTADSSTAITQIRYSFMDDQVYGTDAQNRPLKTSMGPDQKQRIREIFELYSAYIGIDVSEYLGPTVAGDGILKIVLGDMFPNGARSGTADVLGITVGELTIIDNAEPWDNAFGFGVGTPNTVSFFDTAIQEVGQLLGLGNSFDLPPGTQQGSTAFLGRGNPLEQIFPGNDDIVHAQHRFRPDNRDVDMYRFVVAPGEGGELRAETIAERLNDSSTLDTYLTLFRRESNGTLTVIAANNNYFSEDSMVRVNIGPGEYFLSVTGKGNEDNNPLADNTGSGATSQGRYQLRVDYKSSVVSTLSEGRAGSSVVGTAFDGDGDGLAGGNFDFWFRSVAPYAGIVAATAADTTPPRTILVDKAYTGVTFQQLGSLAQPFTKISQATAAARPGDVIRIVGDTRTASLTDDVPYEIGDAGGAIGVLPDGARLDVPKGVTLMVDAGAILKFNQAGILVGSDPARNLSGGSIQILGIPGVPVYLTSYRDESLGRDPDPVLTSIPGAGNWGGIEIRNDIDRAQGRFDLEREGVFLNAVSNADIRFGGGKVGSGAAARAISPIDLFEARPLVLNSRISNSGDAAMSADPNSFEETLFTEPRYQSGAGFVPDYSRVGPDIRSNTFVGNSINGLLVKINSTTTGGVQPLGVAGRINDAEVPIVLGENLIIQGTPGGPLFESIGPDTSLLTLNNNRIPTSGSGFSSTLQLEYLVTYVDRFGQESIPSAIRTTTSQVGRSVELTQLPTATLDYVARKIWRRENNSGPFRLAGLVNKDDTLFVDNGTTLAGTLQQPQVPNELRRARRDASLVVDPGIVIKSAGVRIEVGMGATLMAEGSKSNNVVFTSRNDDRYGAAGTFDTNNNGLGAGAAGDWGGIVSRQLGEVSLDNVIVTFGGGATSVPGGFASFNAIELHQSTARIANSVIENNASGTGTPSTSNRDARGLNTPAAIFVLGSQPVLINNTIRNNSVGTGTPLFATAAISIDANSLDTKSVRDFGRSVGSNQREQIGIGNFGPLVSNNLLGNNGINGMVVRGATLTTESVWDDTGIVHVLQSEIVVPDFHTYGGLRLASRATESLVVKLNGTQAGFTATGRPLDITDRIGGTLQLLGSPGFPVVLTSLADDTIGAGFDFSGRSLGDTNNDGNATLPTAGSWRSVRFEPFSNDRNVDQTYEREPDLIGDVGTNDFPSRAQDLGTLSSSIDNGDENARLGVTLTGSIASPSDLDIYRFIGTAGTMVWFDIDQTSGTLDSVVELIDGNGQIIALSNNSLTESVAGAASFSNSTLINPGRVLPMDQIATAERNRLVNTQVDFQGVNPLDAGMRVVLPGSAGSVQDYFIRVRSSNVSPVPNAAGPRTDPNRLQNPAFIRDGITVGQYKLHVRLSQLQEIAGSTVRYADVRYATVGIDALGQPLHSPLLGETSESVPSETSSTFAPQIVGNVGSSDRAAISIAGNFASGNGVVPDDFIDFYRFTARRDSVQQNSLTDPYHVSLIFDVDYTDGQGRADTQLWIFDANGRLVLTSDNSNIHDDQPAATRGSDVTDLTRGSQGVRDAYIGPIELPPGDYFVGISNKSKSHVALRQFTDQDAAGFAGVRMEPIESVRRIAEDRYDGALISPRPSTAVPPVMYDAAVPITQTGAFPIQTAGLYPSPSTYEPEFDSHVGFNLSDVTLFTSVGRNVGFLNALTGAVEAVYSTNGTQAVNYGSNNNALNDLAVAPGGQGVAFQETTAGNPTDGNQGSFVSVDIGNGSFATGTSGTITTTTRQTPGSNPATFEVIQVPNNGGNNGVGMTFDGLTFSQLFATNNGTEASFWGVGSRYQPVGFQPIIGIVNNTPTAVGVGLPVVNKNILYRLSSYNTGTLGTALDPGNQGPFNAAERGIGAGSGILAHGFFVKPGSLGEVNVGGIRTNVSVIPADGTVTGLASADTVVGPFLVTRLYAVTDRGELMGMTPNENARHVLSDSYVVIRDPNTNLPISFSSLTTGPRDVIDGNIDYSRMLFGTTAAGRLYAFNTDGVLQNIFPGGNSFIDTIATGASGISFSSGDANLWHLSTHRATETGHGVPQNFNFSNGPGGLNAVLRFGYADPNAAEGVPRGDYTGINTVPTAMRNTVAAPGGARGAIESKLIDLRNYSADDQPTLYFNYRLDTEDANHGINTPPSNAYGLDSFRVYGTSEDGNWVLLSTNNAPEVNSSLTPLVNNRNIESPYNQAGVNEFDTVVSRNVDAFGRVGTTAELFDTRQWRQARVSLASLAGKQDVRLRFEFATGGTFRSVLNFDSKGKVVVDSTRGGLEINAVPGERFVNSMATPSVEAVHTFTIRDITTGLTTLDDISDASATTDTFQFDLGLVLNLPSGSSLKTGDRIKIGANQFTFSNIAGPLNIPFTANDTPAQVALNVRTVLANFGYTVVTSTNAGNLLNVTHLASVRLPNSVAAGDYDIFGADKGIIAGRPGVLAGNNPVFVNNAMTATEVRDAIRLALATRYNIASQSTNIDTYRVNRNTIYFHSRFDQFFDGSFSGPVSISNGRTGDISSASGGGAFGLIDSLRASFATRNNTGNVEGVLIDDIIIGFAERGETVFNAPVNNQTFADTPFYEPFLTIGQPPLEVPELGTYQLEIRTAADYGITDQDGQLRLVDPSIANPEDPQAAYYGNNQWGRTYDTNDRLVKGIALSVTGPASQIRDGAFFTLSDGYNSAVFEFDVLSSSTDPRLGVTSGRIRVPLSPGFTSTQVARAIRDTINGATAQSLLKLSASTTGDMTNANASVTGPRSNLIYLNGTAASDVLGNLDFASGGAPLAVVEFGKDATEYVPRSNPPLLPVRPSYFFNYGEDLGDGNSLRDQGQFIVSSSVIRNSSQFGINLDGAPQLQNGLSAFTGPRPYPGSVRNLITLNSGNVTPGAVVINNVIYNNASGGIAISGDTTSTNGLPPSSVSRIINNTLFGFGTGSGITVNDAAAPTIINNIVSNFATGIQISANSTSRTELGYNIYKQNGVNVSGGPAETGAITLSATDPLFVDSSRGLFYPQALSQAIDSSISTIGNRASIEQVRSAVGLSSSTVFAPFLDLNGLVRSDDPDVGISSGSGQNVFIDRGAIDRVDFSGPIATLTRPIDNDSLGVDRDLSSTYVRLTKGNLNFFEILLDEFSGTGTDASTISPNSVILTENGRRLIEGSDYFFGFSANSRTIRLTPLAGFWRNDSVYEMTIINKPTFRIDARDGGSVVDGSRINLTTSNGSPVVLEFDAAGSAPVTGSFIVTAPAAGGTAITDGNTFSIRTPAGQTVVFEFDKNAAFNAANRPIVITDTDSAATIASAIAAAIAAAPVGMTPVANGASVRLNEPRGTQFNVLSSGLTLTGVSGGAIAIPYLPNASFTSSMMSAAIVKALNSVGLGIKVYSLGVSTTSIEGAATATGTGITQIAAIADLAGNWLQTNRANSLTQFTILMPEVGVDYGDAIERVGTGSTSSTLQIDNGVRHALYPDDVPILALGQYASADVDGKPSVAADADDFASSFTFSPGLPLSLSARGPARLIVSTPVFPAIIGKTLTFTDAVGKSVTLEFTNSAVASGSNIAVNLTGVTTASGVAAKLQDTILTKAIFTGLLTGIYSVLDGTTVAIGGTLAHTFDLSNSGGFVTKQASGSVGIAVPANVSTLASGQTFTINDGANNSVTFQIINSAAPTTLLAGNTALTLNLTAGVQTQASFANAVVTAINNAIIAGKLRLPLATFAASTNIISVNGDSDDGVNFVGQFNFRTPPVTVNVTSTDTGYLDAWVDWNQDNDFNDPGEQMLRSESVNAGVNAFTFITPANALSGYTTARFRLSATGGLFTTGLAIGGEVEDHLIEVLKGTPPTAVDDNYQVNEDNTLTVVAAGVLSNDSDADSDPFSVFDSNSNVSGVQPLVLPLHAKSFTLNADGSFSYTPQDNYFGTDSFVYQVTDPRLVSNTPATVSITITPVNDAPFGTDRREPINEDNNGVPFVFSAASFGFNDPIDVPASNSLLEVQILTLPPVADGVLKLGVANVTAGQVIPVALIPSLTFTPASDVNGLNKGSFTFKVRDNGGVLIGGIDTSAVPNTFAFDITAVNDAPSFNLPASTINLNEDPGAQNLANFVTNVLVGPATAADEIASQLVTFRVRALDPTRFAVQPAITPLLIANGGNGNFTFTLAPDVNNVNSGPILVELQADDQGGPGTFPNGPLSLKRTVTINVAQVNDPPTFTISQTNFNTTEDAPRTIIPGFVSNVLVGPATAIDETANQTTVTTVRAVNPSLFSFGPTLNGSGDLEFQLAPDVNSLFTGNLEIVVTVTDNGTPVEATSKTLTINANPINDAPSFVINPLLTVINVDEDNETLTNTTETVVNNFALNLRQGPVTARDEAGLESVSAQTLSFDPIIISNPSIFSQLPTIDAAGRLRFHTEANRSGTSVFVIRLRDSGLAGPPPNSNTGPTATYTINIRAVNDAPEFTLPASTTVDEDQGVATIPGFATGIRPGPASALDESTQELTFLVTAVDPSVFAVQPTIQADGTLVFQTAKDVNNNTRGPNAALLDRRVVVSLRDNGSNVSPNVNLSAAQTFTLNINPVNDPPIPSVHIRPGIEDTQASFTSASIINAVSPESPDAPGPADESAQVVRMTQIERTTDRGGVVTPVFGTGPQSDQIISFVYNPPLNYVGDDLIRYVVTDNGSPQQSATGTVTIQLAPVNDPPQFIPGSDITVQEDSAPFSAPWASGILAGPPSAVDELNGVPPLTPAQTVSFAITTDNNALFAVLPAISPTGVLTFTLAKDANGRAIVDVTAVDSGLGVFPDINRSAVAKLTIVANPVNDAPGFNVIGNVTVDEDSNRYSSAAIKDIVPAEGMNSTPPTGSDEIGQVITIITTNNNTSLFSVQPTISSTGILEFVPAQDAFGTAVVSVLARDNGANTLPNVNQSAVKTFTITLNPKNDAPIAVNDRYTTGEDTVLTVNAPGILTNDRDVDLPNDTITVATSQTTSTLGAIVSVLPSGQFTYDSRNAAQLQRLVNGETAIDTFTYTVKDTAGLVSNLATVTITVSGNNDNPIAVDDNLSVPFGTSQLLNVLANDRDPDTSIDPRTVEIGQLASHGTAIAQSTGRIDYRPVAGFRGVDKFTYRVRDALGAISNEATVTVTINTPPVAVADFTRTNVGTPIVIDVLRNDNDQDGTLNRATVAIGSGPDVGSASVQTDGTIRYSPPAGFGGTATLQYSVLDNDGLASNFATVTILVGGSVHQNPVNNLDVDADGFVSPIDVLILVNDINSNGFRTLPTTLATPPYLDPNGSGGTDALDVLLVINFINERGNAGAGEGEASMAALGYSQDFVRAPSKQEIVTALQQEEYLSSTEGQIDLAVSSVASESLVYGPSLATDTHDDAEESLENYLAGWTTKPKRSASMLDSVFADEDWM